MFLKNEATVHSTAFADAPVASKASKIVHLADTRLGEEREIAQGLLAGQVDLPFFTL
jgi:hypothetical protein